MPTSLPGMVAQIKYAAFVAFLCSVESDSLSKTTYIIGLNIAGNPSQLLRTWKPVLSTYLTETVGTFYNPAISFKLIPVDYDATQSSADLINREMIDFMCKCSL